MQKYLIIHDRRTFICSRILRVAMAVDGYASLGVMQAISSAPLPVWSSGEKTSRASMGARSDVELSPKADERDTRACFLWLSFPSSVSQGVCFILFCKSNFHTKIAVTVQNQAKTGISTWSF